MQQGRLLLVLSGCSRVRAVFSLQMIFPQFLSSTESLPALAAVPKKKYPTVEHPPNLFFRYPVGIYLIPWDKMLLFNSAVLKNSFCFFHPK